MADKKFTLTFDAKMELNEIRQSITTLKNSLATLEIPKESTKGFERTLKKINESLIDFESLTNSGIETLADAKKIETSWNKISTLLSKVGVQIEGLDAGKAGIFPVEILTNITQANKLLDKYNSKLAEVRKGQEYAGLAAKRAASVKERESYQKKVANKQVPIASLQQEATRATAEWKKVEDDYSQHAARMSELTAQIAEKEEALRKVRKDQKYAGLITVEDEVNKNIRKTYQTALDKKEQAARAEQEASNKISDLLKDRENLETKLAKIKESNAALTEKELKKTQDYVNISKQLEQKNKEIAKAEAAHLSAKEEFKREEENFNKRQTNLARAEEGAKEINDLKTSIKQLEDERAAQKKVGEANEQLKNSYEAATQALDKQQEELEEANIEYERAKTTVDGLDREIKQLELGATTQEWNELTKEILKFTGIDLTGFQGDIVKVQEALNQYKEGSENLKVNLIRNLSNAWSSVEEPVNRVAEATNQARKETERFTEQAKEIENLKSNILEFFSITSAIQIFKDAVRDAFNTVKELDAAMTETAVVTDFSISEMWNQLPRYTQAANDLGTTTLGAYETMTLFYQQGLQTNEVFEIGTETMKMARIAGLDYADATNKMTAALRGFNMELDETSARRVNDVYSELAAITAADTEEIANAMTKTASIAHNANMEFETTAAFLSQIIETTRESAETAGTAMKTVIARFQELKKDPSLIGDVDGEIVDANKIETALRTVGVALRDSSGQFRDLDEVFLELASKWQSMDTNTQRYIATIAAGSRQQSRFIAMMSDYDRTMELVNAANESAGASQKQFEKTVDSLESKLNKLSNAWAEYTMGLANSTIVKGVVDILTTLLSVLNDLTSWSGFVTAFNKIMLTLIALKSGGAIADTFFDHFRNLNTETEGLYKFNNAWQSVKLTMNDISGMLSKIGQKFSAFKTKALGVFTKIKDSFSVAGLLKYIGVIGGVVLALGAVVAVYKAIKNNSPEAHLERATDLAKETSEAANEAATSFDNLKTSLEGIEDGTSKLENLTRGTNEWKDAVQEVNNQILDLIEKFPQLAEFVESKGGILIINESKKNSQGQTFQEVYDNQYLRKFQATSVEAAAKIYQQQAQSSVDFKNLASAAKVYELQQIPSASTSGYETSPVVQEEVTRKLAVDLAKGFVSPTYDGIKEWLSENGYENLSIASAFDAASLRDFGQSLIAMDEAVNTLTQSITANALAQIDVTDEEAEVMSNFMTDSRAKAIYDDTLANVEVNDTSKKELASIMGWDYEGGQFYSGEGEEREKIEVTDEYFKTLYASVKAQEAMQLAMQQVPQIISNWEEAFGKNNSNIISKIFEGTDGQALTQSDLEYLQTVSAEEVYEAGGGAETLGVFEQFEADYNAAIDFAQQGFDQAKEKINDLGLAFSDFSFDDGLSEQATIGLSEKLEQVFEESGTTGANEIAQKIQVMSEGLDESEVEDFISSLNAINWQDIGSVQSLAKSLFNFGIEVNGGEAAINELAEAIITLTNATRNLDLETLNAEIDKTSSLIQDVSAREETERVFSAEEAAILKSASPEIKLTKSGEDSYVYAGDNLAQVTELLRKYVLDLIETTPAFENATREQKIDTLTSAYSGGFKGGFDMLNFAPQDELQAQAIEEVINAQIAQEGLQQEITRTAAAITEENATFAKNEKAVKALVLDVNEMRKATKTLCETIEDNNEAFKEGNKQLANGEEASGEYYSVLSQITSKAKDVFGDSITEDFVQANSEAFEQLAQGGEVGAAAFEKIQAAMRAATLTALETDERTAGVLSDIQNWIAQADLDFSVNGYADITDIVNKLLEVGYAVEDAKAILESLLGASVEFKVEYQKMVIPRAAYQAMYSGRGDVTYKDINGLMYEVSIPKSVKTTGGAVARKNTYRGSGYTPSSSGGSKGGGSGSEDTPWENPYDELYNLTRKINEELRERERLERRYQKLLKAHHTGANDIANISEKELSHLEEEVALQKELIEGRKKQLKTYLDENSDLTKYANIQTNEYGEQVIRIDWEAIDAITDQDKGQEIEDYITQLEEWLDSINEAKDALEEIEDTVQEIKERGKDEYFDLEDRIKEAVTQFYQEEIDNLAAINESINDTNTKLLDAIQSSVDKMRQDRDNAETEEEIADKQRQLAYLQQDTSGANDMAILELQKEIDQAQQDYTDTLIDQKISELQEQNDAAAEQRQQQIDLAQAQLDQYVASGEIWQEVYDLMGEGLNEETGLIRGSRLEEILKKTETFEGLSAISQMEWLKELNANVASALAYLKVGRQLEDLGLKEGTEITFVTADGKTLTGKVDKEGNVTVDGKTYSDVYQGYDGNFYSDEEYANQTKPASPAPSTPAPETPQKEEEWEPSVGKYVKIQKGAKFVSGEKVMESVRSEGVISGKKGAFKILKDQGDGNFYVGREWSSSGVTGLINKKYLTKYKTGGLADFTGPAWLDGTKAKPELILNSRDTENFIQLKNVLASLMTHAGANISSENNGDITYDIDINVERIGSDYDIERVAEKVEGMINTKARYRNNNAISLQR